MNNPASPRVLHDVTGTLELLSPMHVGSGHDRPIASVKGKKGDNVTPEVAAIVRDVSDAPYIPGTTIKGLLRRIGARCPGVDVTRLFGSAKLEEAGVAGRVTVFGARRIGDGPAVPEAPFVAGAGDDLGRGVFVAARTRIDPATGTAGVHKLFYQEMVAPKTSFHLRLRIDARAGNDRSQMSDPQRDRHEKRADRATAKSRDATANADATLADLLMVLAPLCGKDGLPVGKGQADGFGRLRLDPATVKIESRALRSDGTLGKTAPRRKWTAPKAAIAPATLRLVCEGPFLVIDASKKPEAGQNPEGERPHFSPQSWGERLPMLLGSSLAGALRARARWLAMRKALNARMEEEEIRAIDSDEFHWTKEDNCEKLSPVQRLFGVTGFRGRLGIVRLRVPQATPWDSTSVKLDRFTAGPVDNALFKTCAFLGATLEIVLDVEDRPKKLSAESRTLDRELFEELLNDIRKNGVVLGHGGNKGYGWFKNEEARP